MTIVFNNSMNKYVTHWSFWR